MHRFVLLLVAILCGQAYPAALGPADSPPPCRYPAATDSTGLLLHRIDQLFPGCVQRGCQGEARPYRADFATSKCFTPDAQVDPPYSLAGPRRGQRLRQGFVAGFRKPIGENGAIEVLRYHTAGAAARSQATMDSIVAECRGREDRAEACVGIDLFRTTRRGRFIVRFNTSAEDPLRRLALRQIRGGLYADL
jgi:hypothetical protein